MNQAVKTESVKKSSTLGQKGFFVISSEKWDKLFLLHKAEKISVADMAAYLVLACGTVQIIKQRHGVLAQFIHMLEYHQDQPQKALIDWRLMALLKSVRQRKKTTSQFIS